MKNYTSSVPEDRTIARIEKKLIEFGASHISKEYSESKEIVGLSFMIAAPTGEKLGIRLPANSEKVMSVLDRQTKTKKWLDGRQTQARKERLAEQSRRTSWRLMQEWVEIQLSLVEMEQA